MIDAYCTASTPGSFTLQLLADADCQAFGLVERGYAALSQPGGTIATTLNGLMVIAVAFFGYRLLLGRGLLLSDTVALCVKFGIVLLIATSWSSWHGLAYEALARGPTQIASEMLVGIGSPPPLESLQRSLDQLAAAGVGYRTRAGIASPLVGGPAAAAMVLNMSAVLLTLSIAGVLVATRVLLAILLAIAPVIAGSLLFAATRGIAQAWIGAMLAAALAPLFILIIAAVEFAILAPMIARLLASQARDVYETAAVMPIGLVTIVFLGTMLMALRAGSRIGYGVCLLSRRPSEKASAAPVLQRIEVASPAFGPTSPRPTVLKAFESASNRDSLNGAARARPVIALGASAAARDMRGANLPSGGAAPVLRANAAPPRYRAALRPSRAASRRDA